MNIRILMTLALIVVPVGGAGAARAQSVPKPTPGPIVTPVIPPTRDRPTWDDPSQHIRIVASYDGSRIRVVSAALGQGSARSYLSQRRDIVVLILNNTKGVLREFNLPDPLEVRVRERSPRGPGDIPPIGEPIGRPAPSESTHRRRQTQFELFVPRLEGAKWLEFHKGSAKGQLLGRLDLSQVK